MWCQNFLRGRKSGLLCALACCRNHVSKRGIGSYHCFIPHLHFQCIKTRVIQPTTPLPWWKSLAGHKAEEYVIHRQEGADSSDTESEDQAHPNSSTNLSRQRTLRRYKKYNRTRIILKQWLFENRYYAHPTEADLAFLAKGTGLTKLQVSNWINNARLRKLPRIIQREGGYRNYYSDSASSSDDYPEPIARSPSPKQVSWLPP